MNKTVYLVQDYICNEDRIYADEVDAIRRGLRIYQAHLEDYAIHASQSKIAEDIDSFIKLGHIKTVCRIKEMLVIDVGEEE